MADPTQRARSMPMEIWLLGFVSMLMDISSELIHSLLPVFLVTVLGTSVLTVGLIEGIAESTALIAKVFSGTLSDYFGKRKKLASVGYGLSALSKPLFALAANSTLIFSARFIDRIGKGIRGAPRDALIADLVPPSIRGAAYGLRQALDTVGATAGPLFAIGLMLLWSDNFRAVFWVAALPATLAVALLLFGVHEPQHDSSTRPTAPIRRRDLKQLSRAYWRIVALGALFMLARFSEAFLVLHAQQSDLPIAWVPLVLVVMNVVYAACAYPFGKLSDRIDHGTLLALGLLVLAGADIALALAHTWLGIAFGVALWGLHMGMTQGLLATMIADVAPAELRGTAFGFFNLIAGLAMLLASALAGLLWDRLGAPATFYTGAMFAVLAFASIVIHPQKLLPD